MTKRIAIAVSLALALSALALVTSRVSARNEKPAFGKVRVSITTDYAKSELSVPVLRFADHPFMSIIRLPDNENGADPNKASAIKIVPYLTEKGAVKIDVSLLFGDVTGITSCEQYKQLKQQPVASYFPRKGEKVTASALKKFGLLAIRFYLEDEVEDDEARRPCFDGCKCGKLCCIPAPGACMGCGTCGECCRD